MMTTVMQKIGADKAISTTIGNLVDYKNEDADDSETYS